jgi:dihydroxyacetone kinase-like protein
MALPSLTAENLILLFQSWKELFAEQRDFLIALDGKVGDSDLGITMSKAFAAAADTLAAEGPDGGISKLLRSAGATMARTAPSTMGTLTASGFLRASKAVEGMSELGTAEMAAFWRAFRDAIAERGKAKVGDKTVLDVLDPIVTTLEQQALLGACLDDALNVTAEAARDSLSTARQPLSKRRPLACKMRAQRSPTSLSVG